MTVMAEAASASVGAAGFGIHIGASNMSLAISVNGRVDALANPCGDRVTPSIVQYLAKEQVVGNAAKQSMSRHAVATVSRVTDFIYNSGREMAAAAASEDSSSLFSTEKDGFLVVPVDATQKKPILYSVKQVATTLFKYLHDIASRQAESGSGVGLVLSVPCHWSGEQRALLGAAAAAAGFSVLQLVSWPLAAALGHQLDSRPGSGCYCVLRCGGQSSDAAVVRGQADGLLSLLADEHAPTLGGEALTQLFLDHLADECQARWKTDPRESARARAKLHAAAERGKHVLSSSPTTQCMVESLLDGVDFSCRVSQARWEDLMAGSGLMDSWADLARRVVAAAGLQPEDVTHVVLCGGSARIPRLRSRVFAAFPQAELLTTPEPDQLLACGAAQQAELAAAKPLSGVPDEPPQRVALVHRDIRVRFGAEDEWRVAVAAGHPVPALVTVQHQVTDAGSLTVQVTDADDPVSLSDLQVAAGEQLSAMFLLRPDKGLKVRVTAMTSGSHQTIDLTCASDES